MTDMITRREFHAGMLATGAAAAVTIVPCVTEVAGAAAVSAADFIAAPHSPIASAWQVNLETIRRAAGRPAAAAIACDVFDAADPGLMHAHLHRLQQQGFTAIGLHRPICALGDPRNRVLFDAAARLSMPVLIQQDTIHNHDWPDHRTARSLRCHPTV